MDWVVADGGEVLNAGGDWVKGFSYAVGLGLLVIFATVSIWVLVDSDRPPTLADPTPENAPRYVCVNDSASAKAGKTTSPSPTPSPKTGGSGKAVRDGKDGSQAGKAAKASKGKGRGERKPDSGSEMVLTIDCPKGTVRPVDQLRGSYDPTARQMALVAIIAPLVTTIVGFLFGARAGAGEAGAQTARSETKRARVEGEIKASAARQVDAQTLVQDLKRKGLITDD